MDIAHLSQELLDVARTVLKLENQRDTLDTEIASAKRRHMELLRLFAEAPEPTKQAETEGGMSVRRRILHYVAAHAPIQQKVVEDAFASLGEKTVRQALYDMTSKKSGVLTRTEAGLALSKKGEEAAA